MSRFVTYLPRHTSPRMRSRWIRSMAVAKRTSQNVRKQYFHTKQARKTRNVWHNVVRRSVLSDRQFHDFFAINNNAVDAKTDIVNVI